MSAARTAVLISGTGSNLQAFIDRATSGSLAAELTLVVANRADARGLVRAARAGLPTAVIDHRDYGSREAFDRDIAAQLRAHDIEFVALAGFMRILSPWLVERYLGRLLNVHPALLPRYPGLDTHRRALASGERFHGSSVHFVTAELDAGPSILQGRLPVAPSTDAAQLARRVQAIEHRIYPEALHWLASGRLRYVGGRAVLDGNTLASPVLRDFD